ncbi:hypothetical protein HYW36_01960 [Candidatus Saccharibacteria bacterium]|nr:hypothetical protein [Candidatus Saccharibacteria bacterium]
MNRKDLTALATVAALTGVISLIIASLFFSAPHQQSSKVPVVEPIGTSLPDIKNDPAYKYFLNTNALDPAQPVQIGNTQNNAPFSNRSQ